MVNEYDNEKDRTENFIRHQRAVGNLSIVDIVKAYEYINTLAQFIPKENGALDDLEDVVGPLMETINELRTDETCPHCMEYLFPSDLPQYDYVCVKCDENY